MLLNKISRIAETHQNAVAVVSGDVSVTYKELEDRADRLAGALCEHHVSPDPLVAIYMKRDAHIIVSIVAAMKSGAAYTVVEHEGNTEENIARIKAMAPDIVVTTGDLARLLQQHGIATITEDDCASPDRRRPPVIAGPETAYVLFTSGSTGTPKGVAITHLNIRHYTESIIERLHIPQALRYAHVSTLSADLGNTCLFLALWTGGTLYLVDGDSRKDPLKLLDYLIANEIDFLKITPSHWRAVFNTIGKLFQGRLHLQYLLLGGETLPVNLAKEILQAGVTRVLANHYGPTEATVGVTVNPIPDIEYLDALKSDAVPIGRPFGQTRLLVRNQDGQYKDRDVEGELLIGGPSVAKGYVGNRQATDANFLTGIDRHHRFYKTGDFVAIDASGIVSFLGRIDRQVKINGYRVELEHVENVLCKIQGIEAAAVFNIQVHDKTLLVAALVPALAPLLATAFKEAAQTMLPPYMIPGQVQWLQDFPLNANGKVDLKALRGLVEQQIADSRDAQTSSNDFSGWPPLFSEIAAIWADCLKRDDFTANDNFFDAGGDSLDAILIISELQVRGYRISSQAFLQEPTIAAIAALIGNPIIDGRDMQRDESRTSSRRFSAAQDWFFNRNFSAKDHWNQAIILEAGESMDESALRNALSRLVAIHPLLRTIYRNESGGWHAVPLAAGDFEGLTASRIVGASETGVSQHIQGTAMRMHQAISLTDGRIFRVHLFKIQERRDHVLFVCHHLSVDAVSWRIMMADLVRLYNAERAQETVCIPDNPTSFWDWVNHIHEKRADLSADFKHWHNLPAAMQQGADVCSNLESDAQTVWLSFGAKETGALMEGLSATLKVPFHVIFLAVFSFVLCRQRQGDKLLVDVESYGRAAFSEDVDISRVVGWFTSTYPVVLACRDDLVETIRHAQSTLSAIPNLGIAYGLSGNATNGAATAAPTLCYNYLGDFHFGNDDGLKLSSSRFPVGPARGAANERIHELKLTARKIDGHLVADLSFSSAMHAADEVVALLEQFKNTLLQLAGIQEGRSLPLHVEMGSSTGVLSYVPRELILEEQEPSVRVYADILLTGATGYIGVHVLREFFAKTSAHIHCLVRRRIGTEPLQRLTDAYAFYFPSEDLAVFKDRLTVLEGDAGEARYGLSQKAYADICEKVDAIYHFAADTRLFGASDVIAWQNIAGIKTAIDVASATRPKDLHYMSTLAVSGVNRGSDVVTFSENSLDIGQEFQNDYERAKFKAEAMVLEFVTRGGTGYIYRSGNVSGHSISGKFQSNAGDNRFIQLLKAAAKLGKAPGNLSDTIVLSPVDTVAEGIVALSLSQQNSGEILHVDSHIEIPFQEIFAEMRAAGIVLEPTDAADFAGMFKSASHLQDPDITLGYFWASRQPRNVRFCHAKTHRLLDKLDCRFTRLDKAWIRKFIENLIQDGTLASTSASVRAFKTGTSLEPANDYGNGTKKRNRT